MSTSQVLYVLLCSFAAALCLWAVASAGPSIAEHKRWHRAWTIPSGTLLLALPLATLVARSREIEATRLLQVLMSPLVLACMWCNARTLRGQGFGARALHLPVQVWNAALCGFYALAAAHDVFGVDVGGLGSTLIAGFVDLQAHVGDPAAERDPLWLYLPFALPLWLAYRWHHLLALGISSSCSITLLALLACGLPDARVRVLSFRDHLEVASAGSRPRAELSAVMPWSDRVLALPPRLEALARAKAIDASSVAVFASTELFADDDLLHQTRDDLARARAQGFSTVVVITPSERFCRLPARDLDELATDMSKAQWLAAEQLAPDWLVLFVGPTGRLANLIVVPATVEDWTKRITRAASEARQANPGVRLAIAIDGKPPHAKELFDRLLASSSPLDGICIVASPGAGTCAEAARTLAVLRSWCERTASNKPIWLICELGAPARLGGEIGQVHWLETVLAEGARIPHLERILVDALVDRKAASGLWTRDGRVRKSAKLLLQLRTKDRETEHREPAKPR